MSKKSKTLRAFVSSCETQKPDGNTTLPPEKADSKKYLPKLRFPEFRKEPEWEERLLRTIAKPVAARADNEVENNVLTLSAEHGLISQGEYFGKKVAGDNAERYILIVRNDFVYNDRTTKFSVYGTIKRLLKYKDGIVSPIYKCFRFNIGESPEFWEWYFESGSHEKALGGLVNEGARAGRFNISIDRFLSTKAWLPPSAAEQQKIADCLTTLDELLAAESQKLDALKTHKKGLMQQLFPRANPAPGVRFPQFQKAPAWQKKPMSELYSFKGNNSLSRDKLNYEHGSVKNIHYGDIHTKYSSLFDITKESVPFINPSEPLTAYKSVNYCTEGDMIFADASEDLQDIGKNIEVIRLNHERLLSGLHTILARQTGDNLVVGFGAYLFKSRAIRVQIEKESQGTKVLGLSAGRLSKIEILFPTNKREQQHIADCLSSLDDLIGAQAQKLDDLKTHKKTLMQQLFPSEIES